MRRCTPLSVLIIVTLAVAQVHAQAPPARPQQMPDCDPALFNGLRYRLVGPSRGGRVTTVTGVPSQPKTPNLIYLGTGSDDVRSNVSTGRGVYKSAGGSEPQQEDPDAPAAGGRGRVGPPPRVTKVAGLNRFVWDVRHQAGVTVPPGQYQARLKVDATTLTEVFNVLIDPRVAEDGVTLADLQEQFEHNIRMRELVNSVNQLAARVRDAQTRLRNSSGTDGDTANRLNAIAERLFTPTVRYSKPGLQAHITYLAGMTANIDQKIGRDAIQRYEVLRKELDEIRAEIDRVLH